MYLALLCSHYIQCWTFLYLSRSFFYFRCVLGNHSCCPNAEVTFPDNNFVLAVKALSQIKSGEVPVI